MFGIFKQIGNLHRADKVSSAMSLADSALAAGRMELVAVRLQIAYKLCLDTTFMRTLHINLTLQWGVFSVKLKELGQPELAAECKKMNALLQARFDAGEYYQDA